LLHLLDDEAQQAALMVNRSVNGALEKGQNSIATSWLQKKRQSGMNQSSSMRLPNRMDPQ